MRTVLVASVPETEELFARVCGEKFQTIHCSSVADAEKALSRAIDLILCEISFDHYRMVDLLKIAKRHDTVKDIPFVCIDAIDNPTGVVQQSMAYAHQYGAAGFIEAYEWRKRLGDELAIEDIRIFIDGLRVFSSYKFWSVGEEKKDPFYRV